MQTKCQLVGIRTERTERNPGKHTLLVVIRVQRVLRRKCSFYLNLLQNRIHKAADGADTLKMAHSTPVW